MVQTEVASTARLVHLRSQLRHITEKNTAMSHAVVLVNRPYRLYVVGRFTVCYLLGPWQIYVVVAWQLRV